MSIVKFSKSISSGPGAYIFRKNQGLLYVGKAGNLKKRLASYFRKNVGEKVRLMLKEATKLDWIETWSEVEAFIKEAELIKKYQPKYNYLMRDDKNYFYVGVTKELYPKIFLTHQPKVKSARYLGPFTSGAALKTTVKLLRRIFPYCTCKKPHKRPCLNSEIGRCPGFCCLSQNYPTNKRPLVSWIVNEYQKNIQNITAVLGGRNKKLLVDLERRMREASKKQEFERAAKLRDQVLDLENIFAHRGVLEKETLPASRRPWPKIEKNIQRLLGTTQKISRVEGYDISNILGAEATGSMVVFIDGFPVKSGYRKFKIRTVHQINDVDMLKEVIQRRLAHQEWTYPDLMLIDGGKAQLNSAKAQLKLQIINYQLPIPRVVALAKRKEELYTENRKAPTPLQALPRETAHFFQRVRDESHRFAKKYHHKLREKLFYEK